MSAPTPNAADEQAWNEAHDRLVNFLRTFELGDHAYVSKLSLDMLQKAREAHQANGSRAPVTETLEQAQKQIAQWLAANLGQDGSTPGQTLATGNIALLLSQAYRTAPTSFLASPIPEELRHALRETLLVTGPDLNISSMTPRHLDFGPMLEFARQTWHRVGAREFLFAVAFWAAVYTIAYWCLSQIL